VFLAFLLSGVASGGRHILLAQSDKTPATPDVQSPALTSFESNWSNRGRWTFGGQLGVAAENAIPRNISHIVLLIAQPQLGFIVRDFRGPHFPVRRFEILSEGILGYAVHPAARVDGTAILFRLDGKNHGHIVPFFDMGAGVQNTPLHTHAPELSGNTQFSPQGGVGIQYFFSPQRAIVFEYRYMHMSNAGLESPNHGFNASMLSLGFRWLRRPRLPAGQPSR
jgi:hypothetical protein